MIINYRVALMKTVTGAYYLAVFQSRDYALESKDLADFVRWAEEEKLYA